MVVNKKAEKVFQPQHLAALDAWIAKQASYADDPADKPKRKDFIFGSQDGYFFFTARDGCLDLHVYDEVSKTFMSVCDFDYVHPMYSVDVPLS